MTLWCKGRVLPVVREHYTTDLQTLLLWQLRSSLWWIPPGSGGNIIQKPQKSLLVACVLSAAPWLLYPHGMLENWEAAEGWQMLGRPPVCHCYLFEWTTLMLKCDAEFSLIFFLHKLKMHIARPQFPQMTVLICRPSWRQLGWNELVRTELRRWDYCHHRKRKRAELFLI